jgi:hypothetical protein
MARRGLKQGKRTGERQANPSKDDERAPVADERFKKTT